MKNSLFLSVVFSFRNEEEVLAELIRRTSLVLNQEKDKGTLNGYELIFVNDASTDRSLEILLEKSQHHPQIRVVNMSRCFGVTPCTLAGMEFARGDAVVYMDADLQDPPELIPKLIQFWQEQNVDVVHTIRQSRRGEAPLKIFVSRLGYHLINFFSSIRIPVEAGDFKLLSRRAVKHLIKFHEIRPYMRGMVSWIGFKQASFPYIREARFAGKSKFALFSWPVLDNFFGSALISFSSVPLKLAGYLGFIAILFNLILTAHVLNEKLHGRAIPGWTAIMIATLFMGGVQLFCIGIIGLYLNNINEQTKGRPRFIIESTLGFEDSESCPPKAITKEIPTAS